MIEIQRVSVVLFAFETCCRDVVANQHKVPQQLLDFFPLQDLSPMDSDQKDEADSIENRLRRLTQSLTWQKPIPTKNGEEEAEINRPGSFYRRYRSVEDLPESARAFYDKAGRLYVA